MAFWTNILKYIKIFLVHPATEISLNIIYLVSFLVIGLILFKSNKYYNEIQLLEMTESYLYFNTFNNIKTPSQFNNYFLSILDKLYTINPKLNEIPMFITISPIRFITFINSNGCNTELDYTKNCRTDPEKFKCVIDNLLKSYEHQCGESYSDSKKFFQNKLTGHYSSYNIRNSEDFIDLTRETYFSKYKDQVDERINNKQIKAIIMQINLIAPSNGNYIDVVLGIEMTNYFTDIKTIFSVYVLQDQRPKTNTLMFIFIILFCISIVISIIKLIYEINVQCVLSVHILVFLAEVLDAVFMVVLILFVIEDKNLEFKVNLNEFECHLKYINIIWFLKLFLAISVIFFPLRFMSLISWWKSFSEPFIIVSNVIFRMIPGIIISLILLLLMVIMFFITNYLIFNDTFEYYETMFKSLISTFNIRIINNLFNRKKPSRIFGNLFQSKYSISLVFFQVCYFYFYMAISIATLAYLYKKAIISLEPKEENIYIKKLEEIEEKLEEKKQFENENIDLLKKQILWLNLDKKNSNDNYFTLKHEVLLFKNPIQILSYLKYIFAIKPEMQFKKLMYKLNIIIEIAQKKVGENEIKQINLLAEWLTFVGSKIPIIIYGKINFEPNIKMKLSNIYKLIYFINDAQVLEKIIEDKGKRPLCISENNNFTFNSIIK